jgi:hypothetical protein
VPAGSATVSASEPTVVGAALPFFVTLAATKDLPVPVASTSAVNEREPSPPLKEG